jgi:hypothetical protein
LPNITNSNNPKQAKNENELPEDLPSFVKASIEQDKFNSTSLKANQKLKYLDHFPLGSIIVILSSFISYQFLLKKHNII